MSCHKKGHCRLQESYYIIYQVPQETGLKYACQSSGTAMAFQSCIAFLDKRNLILLINPTLNLYCPQGRSLTWASVLSLVEGNFWRGNQRRDINHQYLWQLRNEFLVPRRRSGQCTGTSTIYLDSLREEDPLHYCSSRLIGLL